MNPVDQLPLPPAARRWLMALMLGVITLYAVFFALFLHQSGPGDSDQFLVFHSLQYWNAAMFGMAKQWTPLLCSGLSMAGEPQIPFMSLSMAFTYLAGPLWGVRCATVLYLVLGWTGAYLYAGLWLRVPMQRTLAATLFIGNGFFFCRIGMGHFDFVPFLTLPLMLWVLHRVIEWDVQSQGMGRVLRLLQTVLLLGAALAFVMDGSPVAIIHLVFWVSLYAATVSFGARSATPIVVLAGALLVAAFLDAGYLWPMLQAQASFPRRMPDKFTSLPSLVYFAVVPIRGKLFPANGNGHELSVFIGPVLAYCLWRSRHWLCANLPPSMGRPLLVVSLVSIVLGMGSLKGIHVPTWLSPFDTLRPLPGFRSIGVTGRYWGFLALPLSLMSAVALWKYASELGTGWRLHLCFGLLLLFQLCFQAETLTRHWFHSPPYRSAQQREYFKHGPEVIEYVAVAEKHLQGELIAPTRGVCDCYDMDDFTRADIEPGHSLIMGMARDGQPLPALTPLQARFAAWSHIRLSTECQSSSDVPCVASAPARMQVTLRQAYHPNWKAAGCEVHGSQHGNLIVDCPVSRLHDGPVELVFDDTLSDLAARVSLMTWKIWLCTAATLLLICFIESGRARRPPEWSFEASGQIGGNP
jgi:hypothetical protein